MIKVFLHEFKRLCLNRTVQVLSALSVVFAVLLVYVVISNTDYDVYGSRAYRSGLDAIAHAKTVYKPSYGFVTPEKLAASLKVYQDTAVDYPEGQIPDAVREKKTAPLSPVLRLLLYTYDTLDVSVETAADFYKQRETIIEKSVDEQYPDSPAAQDNVKSINQRVRTPFYYAYGYGDSDGPEFLVFLLFVLVFFCAVIAAPVFSEDYSSRADDIQRCCRYGRQQLGTARILAVYTLVLLLVMVCTGIYLVSLNTLFGWEGLKASLQTRYFTTAITPMTIGGVMGATVLSGILTLLATASCAIFVSSRCRSPVAALAGSVMIALLPAFLSFLHIGEGGLASLLPSGGIISGNGFYQTLSQNSLEFLNGGAFTLWLPYAYVLFAAVEIPLFSVLAVWSYKKQEVY